MHAGTLERLKRSPFLNVEEAADYLGLTRSTLDHYRWAGGGPEYRKHGGRVLYHVDELNAWSENGRYKDSATRSK
ncbi:MAG: helix-turn-helix domain-containing protein [Pseudomonadota bacterium]